MTRASAAHAARPPNDPIIASVGASTLASYESQLDLRSISSGGGRTYGSEASTIRWMRVERPLPGEPTVKDGGRWGMAVPDYDGGGWNKDFVFHGGWERYAPMPTRTAHL